MNKRYPYDPDYAVPPGSGPATISDNANMAGGGVRSTVDPPAYSTPRMTIRLSIERQGEIQAEIELLRKEILRLQDILSEARAALRAEEVAG